jgi:hypothetical protein
MRVVTLGLEGVVCRSPFGAAAGVVGKTVFFTHGCLACAFCRLGLQNPCMFGPGCCRSEPCDLPCQQYHFCFQELCACSGPVGMHHGACSALTSLVALLLLAYWVPCFDPHNGVTGGKLLFPVCCSAALGFLHPALPHRAHPCVLPAATGCACWACGRSGQASGKVHDAQAWAFNATCTCPFTTVLLPAGGWVVNPGGRANGVSTPTDCMFLYS